jgi:hypothetical protein
VYLGVSVPSLGATASRVSPFASSVNTVDSIRVSVADSSLALNESTQAFATVYKGGVVVNKNVSWLTVPSNACINVTSTGLVTMVGKHYADTSQHNGIVEAHIGTTRGIFGFPCPRV